MGGSSQPTTTTQIQKTELPAWVDQGGQDNYQFAKDVSAMPTSTYTGQRVAGMNGYDDAAQNLIWTAQNYSNTGAATALQAAQAAMGYKAPTVNSGGSVADVAATKFNGADLANYLNPYTSNVVDTTLSGMRDNLKLSSQAADDAARGQGAWGGSRSGVQQAVLAAEGAKGMASTEAGLRSAAYTDAAGRLMQDNTSALQAALANQSSAQTTAGRTLTASQANAANSLSAANLGLQGGQLGLSAGTTAAADTARNSVLESQMAATKRGIDQSQLDVDYGNWLANDPKTQATEALNTRLAALGMSPYGKTTSSTSTQSGGTSSNGLLQGVGVAASILPLLFSDRDVKKDVERVGKTENDLNVYTFKYKKGFMGRDMPEQVGLMADDVKRKVPEAVKSVNVDGKSVDAVDYGLALTPRKTRSDKGSKRGPNIGGNSFLTRGLRAA